MNRLFILMSVVITVFLLFNSGLTFGQAPEKMTYQAVIRDSNNHLVMNSPVGLRISVLQGSAGGIEVYKEIHFPNPVTNDNGLLTVEIGDGVPVIGAFHTIDWTTGLFFLKTETDPTGGTNYSITGTSQLLSVPYALHAKTADSLTGGFNETDPLFNASIASGITGADTASWNAKITLETDPLFNAWDKTTGISITESQITDLQNYLLSETDPIFNASVASGITVADTAVWNAKISVETDPHFNASVAAGITVADTAVWNAKLTAESDPVFNAWDRSTGINITESQITNLQPYLLTESDPVFNVSVAAGITAIDTAYWNQKPDQYSATQNLAEVLLIGNNANASKIKNLADPADNQDAATKAYVDSKTLPYGTNTGEMLFWNGNEWLSVVPGNTGQTLTFCDGLPTWGPCVPIITTNSISNISDTAAIGGGNITGNAGSPVITRGICWSINPNPTILDDTTINGTGTGSFVCNIKGLTPNTTYYVRAYATNAFGIGYGNELSFKTNSSPAYIYPVYDIDGNGYDTVNIGTQIWLKQNLRTTRYNNGGTIANVTDNAMWAGLTTGGAMCWYQNDSASYDNTYGALYNWYAISDTNGLCPTGWHVPTDAEWTILTDFLGGSSVAGGQLKATTHWESPNSGANNSSGFTALPGGARSKSTGSFSGIESDGLWWSSTSVSSTSAYARKLYSDSINVTKQGYTRGNGLSVRCIIESGTPSQPSLINGINEPCENETGLIYNVNLEAGVIYTWSVPVDWSITYGQGTHEITVTAGLAAGNIEVTPSNNFGNGPSRTLTVTTLSTPYNPTEGIHVTDTNQIEWKWNAVAGAIGYKWNNTIDFNTAIDKGNTTSHTEIALSPATNYIRYVWAYNDCGESSVLMISETTDSPPFVCGNSITDIDSNVYNTVQIGMQCWIQENLKTATYNDGAPIPHVTDNAIWSGLNSGAYCWYNNDYNTYGVIYGALYNWHAVNNGNLCPVGWKVPSDPDWQELEMHLGMAQSQSNSTGFRGVDEGGKMKSTRTAPDPHPRWISPNVGSTNASGFTALPGGLRNNCNGFFYNLGSYGYYWASSAGSATAAWNRLLLSNYSSVYRNTNDKKLGFSVRCIIE